MSDSHFSGAVDSKAGFKVNGTEVIDSSGNLTSATKGIKQYAIIKPEVGAGVVVNAENISGGDVAVCTVVREILDYPRNLLYTIADDAATTNVGTFTVIGTDQFGVAATETKVITVASSATGSGTQVFATITSVAYADTSGTAAVSDTASVGVSVAADVASFGLPEGIAAITDVKSVNWIDDGAGKTQNIDATSVVIARDAFRPEQTVAAADDYIILYNPTNA